MKKGPFEPVRRTSEAIRTMEIRGAGRIARAASSALSEMVEIWDGPSRDELLSDLKKAAGMLHATRPSAVSLRNAILLTLKGAELEEDVDSIREAVRNNSSSFLKASREAVEVISRIGMKRIPKGSTVMTHCNSSAALSIIEAAFNDGRIEEVYATESRPCRQGQLTAGWLAERGIPVTMIVDSAARFFMNGMDMVCVGADTVAANGAVINKIGTAQIALAAHEARTPFMVAAETYKFSPETLMGSLVEIEDRGPEEVADPLKPEDLPGVKFKNPVFDATPPEYIDSIVCELGIISPYMATEIIREMFGGFRSLSSGRNGSDFRWL